MPVVEGSEGALAVDISRLRTETGLITLDPGFGNTAECRSAITYVDGEKGILSHRAAKNVAGRPTLGLPRNGSGM